MHKLKKTTAIDSKSKKFQSMQIHVPSNKD